MKTAIDITARQGDLLENIFHIMDLLKNKNETYNRSAKVQFLTISKYFNYMQQFSWSILLNLGLFCTISVYLRLSRTISDSDYMGLSGTIWDCLGLSGTIWDYFELSGTIWDYMGLSGIIWVYMEL